MAESPGLTGTDAGTLAPPIPFGPESARRVVQGGGAGHTRRVTRLQPLASRVCVDASILFHPMASPVRSSKRWIPRGRTVGILDAGRQALETSGYCAEVGLTTVFFAEEAGAATTGQRGEFSAPIVSFEALTAAQCAMPVISAVGQPSVRAALVAPWRGSAFATGLDVPSTVDICSRIMSLPMADDLPEAVIDRIATITNAFTHG
jgi:hypothetical protein